ncbi:MAG: formylglycine-generating enzyme family protein [Desulfosarcinaceae bacterium]|nr:formylglycine-generating enzyme family protein [Desulfosarcinaceae bacterium]
MKRPLILPLICLLSLLWLGPAMAQSPFSPDDFVTITGACFYMGDQFGDGGTDEVPVHRVCLSDYALAKYEVTQAQWTAIMGSNPSNDQTDANYPVDVVSWYDVETFIERLNAQSDGKYRLPTEAEWEFACRAGGQKRKYGTADGRHADHLVIHAESAAEHKGMRPVGSFAPNALGLYDMTGNASEWVLDWYHQDYYQQSPVNDPKLLATRMETLKVRRGGSWRDRAWVQRCTYRNWRKPGYRLIDLGFRLARDP